MARLRARQEKGLVVYIGAGDPNLDATRALALAFERVGVDVLELGVPFSDPLADGLVNQLAAQRGLDSGTTPAKVLAMVASLRRDCSLPVVLYLYYNLIHRVGLEPFVREAASAGVDGCLVLDLPPEEAGDYDAAMEAAGLCPIYLLAPTTPPERMAIILRRARGFVYYVSREGVTGMQESVARSIPAMMARIRAQTPLPIAVGFGISNPAQARAVAESADAVVVGSAIVDRIAGHQGRAGMVEDVTGFVAALVQAVKT